MREAPSNSDDIIDSRDVIARLDELTAEREGLQEAHAEAVTEAANWASYPNDDAGKIEAGEAVEAAQAALATWDDDNLPELNALTALQDEAEGYAPDWSHGATLIRRTYWPTYAEELVRDIGDLPKDLPGYIANNIDWEGVADDLEVDYTTVDFDGIEYLIR